MALTQISTDGIKNGTITGSDLATNIDLVDDQKLRIGTGNDLEFFHNGTRSEIKNSNVNNFTIRQGFGGNGFMFIHADKLQLRSHSTNHQYVSCYNNGQVEIYHANSKTFETTTTGATLTGTLIADGFTVGDAERIKLGNDGDLELYHTGTETFIKNSTGTLNINNDGVTQIKNYADDEFIAKFTSGGSVELYHANSKKFETTSTGANVTSANDAVLKVTTTGTASTDDARIELITQESTFTIQNDRSLGTDGALTISPGSAAGIYVYKDGAVELYFNNSLRLSTTANGVTLDHNLLLDNATNAGRDVKWDPSNDQLIWNDSTKACFGDSADLQIFHDGHSIIKNTHSSAAFLISSHATHIVNAAVSENIAKFIEGTGGVELYHTNSKKFETTSTGCFVVGSLGVNPPSTGNLNVNKEGTGILISLQTTGTTRGSITSNGSTVAFNTSVSDRSMKKNFENWTENTLALFKNINPQRFNFLDQEDGTKKEKGFIAQDMFNSFPEAYQKNDDDKYVFNPSGMVVYLMKAIQELEAEVAALKAS